LLCFCGIKEKLILAQSEEDFTYFDRNTLLIKNLELNLIKVKILNEIKIITISCGHRHTIALTENGQAFGWGDNTWGQLGVLSINVNKLTLIDLDGVKIEKVSCGTFHSLFLSSDGDIYV
jgi:hypothetical protein